MTPKDKELLIKDLCARLPYDIKCKMLDELRVVNNKKDPSYTSTLSPKHIELLSYHNNFTIKPFLRPMSSMTEDEVDIFTKFGVYDEESEYILPNYKAIEWLIKNHFDYHGLIDKGLAIKVTEENNPYKQ